MLVQMGLLRCALVIHHRKDVALVAAILSAWDPEIMEQTCNFQPEAKPPT